MTYFDKKKKGDLNIELITAISCFLNEQIFAVSFKKSTIFKSSSIKAVIITKLFTLISTITLTIQRWQTVFFRSTWSFLGIIYWEGIDYFKFMHGNARRNSVKIAFSYLVISS